MGLFLLESLPAPYFSSSLNKLEHRADSLMIIISGSLMMLAVAAGGFSAGRLAGADLRA